MIELTYATSRRGVHKQGQPLYLPVGWFGVTSNINATKNSPYKNSARIILPNGSTIQVEENMLDLIEYLEEFDIK